jgi:hypothetical protein
VRLAAGAAAIRCPGVAVAEIGPDAPTGNRGGFGCRARTSLRFANTGFSRLYSLLGKLTVDRRRRENETAKQCQKHFLMMTFVTPFG